MKKITFLFLIILLSIPTVKAQSKFYISEKIEDIYIEYHKWKIAVNDNPYIIKREDGEVAYCLDPWAKLNQEEYYNEYAYNDLSDSELQRINLIAYYGYKYPGHEDNKWYAITQYMIWNTPQLESLFFTDTQYGNRIEPFNDEINEIKSLMKKHNTLPSFANETIDIVDNNSYIVEDYNNVLNDYIIYDSNIPANISNNNLNIDITGEGEYYIKFKRKREMDNNYILYGLDGAQPVIVPGGVNTVTFSVNISVKAEIYQDEPYDPLVVEVPDTMINQKYFSKILLVIGIILVVFSLIRKHLTFFF